MPLWTPLSTLAQPTFPSAPSLSTLQFEINSSNGSLVIGAGTAFPITEITGLGDLPEVRNGDVAKPRASGQFMGFDYAGGRDVTIKGNVIAAYGGGATIQALLADIAAVMVPSSLTEYPLWFKLPNTSELCLMCRPRDKTIPYNTALVNSQFGTYTLKFHATDPRCYQADSPYTIAFSSSTGALDTPIGSPPAYTGTATSGTFTGGGNVSSDFLIEIVGPCTAPFVFNTTTEQALALQDLVSPDGVLNSGDVLWIDMSSHAVVYWPSGASAGQSQRGWLAIGSQWFSSGPSNTSLKVGATGGSGGSVVFHAPLAWML